MDLKIRVLEELKSLEGSLAPVEIAEGVRLREEGLCTLLAQSAYRFDFLIIDHRRAMKEYCVEIVNDEWRFSEKGKIIPWNGIGYACLLMVQAELEALNPKGYLEHKKY